MFVKPIIIKKRKNNNITLPPKIFNTSYQQSIIENVNNIINVLTYEKHRHVNIGPSNVGKTFYMLKVLGKIGNKRPIQIKTRSPYQNPDYKTSNEIKPINKYKVSVVNFDAMLGAKIVLN